MAKATKESVIAKRPRRASQRTVLHIDLADQSLRDLMIEQCKDGGRFITVYRGSRAELMTAGILEAAFPKENVPTKFQVKTLNVCCTGSHELLDGSMCSTSTGFELEIDWHFVQPSTQGAHPAVCELARMILKDVLRWTRATGPWANCPDLEHPLDMLIKDERAVGYKPHSDALRLQVTSEFHEKLGCFASSIHDFVHTHCEVMPSQKTAAKQLPPSRPSLRVVAGTTFLTNLNR